MPENKITFKEMIDGKNEVAIDEQVSVVLTRECPVLCEHCYSNCGPDAPKGDNKKILARVRDICSNENIRTILLTGGETFTEYDFLLEVVKTINEYDKNIILYTNGYWANSVDIVKEKLSKLSGVTLINTSIDRFHQKYIPINNIVNLVKGAQELGFYNGVVVTLEPGDNTLESEVRSRFAEISEDYLSFFIQDMGLVGRAKGLSSKYEDYLVCSLPKGVCTLITSVIDESGDFFGCCTVLERFKQKNPFFVGNIDEEDFCTVYKRFRNNIVVLGLRVLGPSRLAKLVINGGKGDKIKKKKYLESDFCAFCIDLFSDSEIYDFLQEELLQEKWQEKLRVMEQLIYGEGEVLVT